MNLRFNGPSTTLYLTNNQVNMTINNTLTPETYNIETAYNIIMVDNGATYLGDYAKAWNKQVGALFMDLTVYAQRKQLPNPATVVMLDKPTRGSRTGNTIKKSPNGSITISPSRLAGTPLANYNEINITVNDQGQVVLSPVLTGTIPAANTSPLEIVVNETTDTNPMGSLVAAVDGLLGD